jgi:hypothetical protein
MEDGKLLINELMGKKVLVKTHGGSGIKDIVLVEGNYVGTLLSFDGTFLKIEYTIRKFQATDAKDTVLINLAYVITIEEFRQREDQA